MTFVDNFDGKSEKTKPIFVSSYPIYFQFR